MDNYFDGPGSSKPSMDKKPVMAKPAPSDNDGDEGGAIQIHEANGGASFEFDGQTYSSPAELCDALEAKYGGGAKPDSKPAATPEKSGGYLAKAME